jgi:flagellar hook-associated protein 2
VATIDGLVSGLNTTQIISQLMKLERSSQDRLRVQQTQTETGISALRSLNAKFLSISSAAKTLMGASGWNAAAATSSDVTRASATSKAGAAAGEVTFAVKQLASTEVLKSAGTVTATTDLVAAASSTFTITKDGTAVSVSTGDGTLAGVVDGINAAKAGVTASMVQVSPGAYALQLTSTTSGATTLTVDGDPFAGSTLGSVSEITPGANAQLQVGVAADGSGGYAVERTSNTISDLLSGTTVTLLKQDATVPVTVRAASDSSAVADNVANLVDNLNATLAEMKRTGSYDPTTKKSGPLYSNGAVRGLRNQLVAAVSGSSTNSPAVAGISVQRDGTVAFDRSKFLEAHAADPGGVRARLGEGTTDAPGLSARLAAVSDAASRPKDAVGGTGILTAAIGNRERSIAQITSDITRWDQRLELREQRLVAQFTAMEKALGSAQQQGQWLAGQIASLPRY